MSLPFTDDFARSDSALGGVGNGWEDPTNSWQIASGRAAATGNSFGTNWLARPSSEATDRQSITTTLSVSGGTSNLLICRADAAGHDGYPIWYAAGSLSMGKLAGGSLAGVANVAASLADGQYAVTLVAYGTLIVGTVAAESDPGTVLARISRYDSSYAAGTAAIAPLGTGLTADDFSYSALPAAARQVVAGVDSITYGQGIDLSTAWPIQALAAIGYDTTVVNTAVPGRTLATAIANAATEVDALCDPVAYPDGQAYVAFGGTNDLWAGDSVATVQGRIQTLCEGRRAVGFRVVVSTILPRGYFTGSGLPGATEEDKEAEFEVRRAAFNTWLRANWQTFADALADPAADTRIGDDGDEDDGTYYQQGGGDKTHPTVAGAAVLAEVFAPAIASVLTPGVVLSLSAPNGTPLPSGSTYAAGNVPHNAIRTLTLANNGTVDATGLGFTAPAGTTVVSPPTTVPAGGTVQVRVKFPVAGASVDGDLVITFDGGSYTVGVTATVGEASAGGHRGRGRALEFLGL